MRKKWQASISLPWDVWTAIAHYCETNRVGRSEAVRQLIVKGLSCTE